MMLKAKTAVNWFQEDEMIAQLLWNFSGNLGWEFSFGKKITISQNFRIMNGSTREKGKVNSDPQISIFSPN